MSIQAAVTYVGLEMLKSLALSAGVFDALDDSPIAGRLLADLQARSLRRAHLARLLLGESRFAEEAFTAALMLDIGQAVLALGDPGAVRAHGGERRSAQSQPWHVVEPQFFGVAHPEVGACLLGLWGLPLELVEIVAYHHVRIACSTPAIPRAGRRARGRRAGRRQRRSARCKLLPLLDPSFIARPEVQRCLRDWHIDEATESRSAERALALCSASPPGALHGQTQPTQSALCRCRAARLLDGMRTSLEPRYEVLDAAQRRRSPAAARAASGYRRDLRGLAACRAWTGRAFLARARELVPNAGRILLTSGHTNLQSAIDGGERGADPEVPEQAVPTARAAGGGRGRAASITSTRASRTPASAARSPRRSPART